MARGLERVVIVHRRDPLVIALEVLGLIRLNTRLLLASLTGTTLHLLLSLLLLLVCRLITATVAADLELFKAQGHAVHLPHELIKRAHVHFGLQVDLVGQSFELGQIRVHQAGALQTLVVARIERRQLYFILARYLLVYRVNGFG